MMGGSNSGVSVGHGENAVSYENFEKSKQNMVAFGDVCGTI